MVPALKMGAPTPSRPSPLRHWGLGPWGQQVSFSTALGVHSWKAVSSTPWMLCRSFDSAQPQRASWKMGLPVRPLRAACGGELESSLKVAPTMPVAGMLLRQSSNLDCHPWLICSNCRLMPMCHGETASLPDLNSATVQTMSL